MATKPKRNQPETPTEQQERDLFETPFYAVNLLIPFIPKHITRIWEPCAGQGKIVDVLVRHYARLWLDGDIEGYHIYGSDICGFEHNDPHNALDWEPTGDWQCAITNPPFSLKKKIWDRFIGLGNPFALLVPADWSLWIWEAVNRPDVSLIVPSRRINYITPTGKSGKNSSAQFHSQWITFNFGIPKLNLVELTREEMECI